MKVNEETVSISASVCRRCCVLLALMWTSAARADFFNGNELHTSCSFNNQSGISAYVAGVFDKTLADHAIANFHIPSSEIDRNPNLGFVSRAIKPFCLPETATLKQVKDVVCKWLNQNPAQRHLSGAPLVQTALAEAFPCKK
ncbi:hypothetical protein I6F34_10505 [Bradyrhizobium sp. BRP05]|nr:hypothetical protein [Bradyrhizobium sp. BRP05]MCA1418611.1 hypothetical protein [Bradyrhizobium sp. BRP23]